MTTGVLSDIRTMVEAISPVDAVEAEHRRQVLDWLDRTTDVFRRAKPRTPPMHLVSYFLVVDPVEERVLLVDHIKAGRWLPTGGHVEPDEHPVDTVRREIVEELGITAAFADWSGEQPLFVTVTETVGDVDMRHTDVSLWFVVNGDVSQPLSPDPDEFNAVRWWTADEIAAEDPSRFDPHLPRMLQKVAAVDQHRIIVRPST